MPLALNQAMTTAFHKGPLMSFPVIGVKLSLVEELNEFAEVRVCACSSRDAVGLSIPMSPQLSVVEPCG